MTDELEEDLEAEFDDEVEEDSMPQPAKAWEEGVYRWVKKFWSEEDVGMLFFLQEGQRRVLPWNRRQNGIFDWYSYFIEEGYVERVPGAEGLGELIRERNKLDAKIRRIKAKVLEDDD